MPTASSPTNRLNGWSERTVCEMPDSLTSRLIPFSRISTTSKDTPRFSGKCACRHSLLLLHQDSRLTVSISSALTLVVPQSNHEIHVSSHGIPKDSAQMGTFGHN